jgi:hypothetical protein
MSKWINQYSRETDSSSTIKSISIYQHLLEKADNELYLAAHETLVFFLQNKSGSEKWPASDENVERLKVVWLNNHV